MAFDYTNKEPLIRMDGIVKEFSGVCALGGITFDVYKGETHCLVGENGAGKSTLMKILSGAYTPTGGTITVDGKTYTELTPRLRQHRLCRDRVAGEQCRGRKGLLLCRRSWRRRI